MEITNNLIMIEILPQVFVLKERSEILSFPIVLRSISCGKLYCEMGNSVLFFLLQFTLLHNQIGMKTVFSKDFIKFTRDLIIQPKKVSTEL